MDDQTLALLERLRRFAMPDGPVSCKGTWLRQVGEMRLAPNRPWRPFEAEQRFNASAVDFRWEARVRLAPYVRANVIDAFEEGRGILAVRWLGIVPVAGFRGAAVDKGEAMRGLAEQPWRPFPFAEAPCLTWAATLAGTLRATFDDSKTRTSVEFDMDAEGRVLGARAPDRPRTVGKAVVETPWSGTFGEYRRFGGRCVPTQAEVTWHLPEGPFTYWRCRLTEFQVVE
ncbi:MAG: hypothetical protein HY237_07885 [Acidobacteria bacterium]|nr:hypothetical protein [Acidobacteriota bacterium]